MSYLDLPRFTFLGKFYTDPSTVNNDPSHYDPKNTKPSPWQDPKGTHSFRLTKVEVTGAMGLEGNLISTGDPLIGAAVYTPDQAQTNPANPARIVDLDVYQQGTTMLFGLTIDISIGGQVLTGSVDTPVLNSMRFTRVLPTRGWQDWDGYGSSSFGGDTYAVGYFRSVMRVDPTTWPTGSPLLDALKSKAITDSKGNILLSLRLVLDNYQNVPWHDDFRTGRVLGTIGPVLDPEESVQAPGPRWLNARPIDTDTAPWYFPYFYGAPFQVATRDGGVNTIVIDMANAVALESPGGPPVDLGDLMVQIGNGQSGLIGPFQANDNLYTALGGIIEMPLTQTQFDARRQPVSIQTSIQDIGGPALWNEDPSGLWFAAEDRSIRMTSEPDSSQRTWSGRVKVTQWGDPAPNVQLGVVPVSVVKGTKGATVPWSAGYEGNTLHADGALKASVGPSDANGWATVGLEVLRDPGSRTEQLDSQLYFVALYNLQNPPPNLMQAPAAQEQQISTVVWASYPVNENPDWPEIQAMMAPYDKLYPAMSDKIMLSDPHAFQTFATNPPWSIPGRPPIYPGRQPYKLPNGNVIDRGAIPQFMTLPIDDSLFMPISRDLSPNKTLTVLYFIYKLCQQFPPTA